MMAALGASGDAYTVAVNPIRDTIFGGNQTLYSIAEAATIMGAGAVTAYNNPGLLPQEGIKPPKPVKPPIVGKYTEEEILKKLKSDGFKNNPLRIEYEGKVRDLAKEAEKLLKQGMSEKDVAKKVWQMRRDLGVKYKNATPQPLRDYIYGVNKGRYGDPLGQSFEKMLTKKSYAEIIQSSSKPNSDIDSLLSGFESWLRRQ